MIRALVFDFDGIILDTESVLIEAYARVHRAHGLPFDRSRFDQSVGHVDFTFDPWHAFGPGADRALLEEQRRRHNREMALRLEPLPGVRPLIVEARAAGIRLGVASNSGHDHVDGHLNRLGLSGLVEFVACREDVASPKPEPDLYRLVLNRFGLRGVEAVALEDSQTGLTAAKRAGLWTVAAPGASTGGQDFAGADWRVGSLAGVNLAALTARFAGRDGASGRPA